MATTWAVKSPSSAALPVLNRPLSLYSPARIAKPVVVLISASSAAIDLAGGRSWRVVRGTACIQVTRTCSGITSGRAAGIKLLGAGKVDGLGLPTASEKHSALTRASMDVTTASESSGKVAMKIVPAVIVGAGRVGRALEAMGGGQDIVIRRGESIPADSEGPIIVCTRNDALEAIIDSTPASRREDLVFIQNGMLEPFLESKGLAHATIVLVYFAVAKLGDAPVDGKTDLSPDGLTAAFGKWAPALSARLQSARLSCKVLDSVEFKKALMEKLIWIAAFMLVGARHPGATVGVVESNHRDEVVSLIRELSTAAETEKNFKFDSGIEERLCAYARSVGHFPTAIKEFEWRNGWFFTISTRAIEKGETDPLPLHTAWLKEVGAIPG